MKAQYGRHTPPTRAVGVEPETIALEGMVEAEAGAQHLARVSIEDHDESGGGAGDVSGTHHGRRSTC